MSILNDKEITSVQDGNTNEFPSTVDAPSPPKSEVMKHTGAKNIIDPQIYHQNVKIRSVNWSVNDERGKVLLLIPVDPSNMGAFVEYLQPMYHYWSGGVCFEIRIMGTAYQAGQVAMVELPPEADAYAIANSGDYTGYNWVALDVKDPALISIHCRDVNQGAFHYVTKVNAFGPLNIGSQFLLVVDSPLNSTTGGTQQVGIEVWAKPSPEFTYSRLRIPRTVNIPTVSSPREIEYALDFAKHGFPDMLSNCFYKADKISFLPSTVKTLNCCFTNHFDLQGKNTTRTATRQADYVKCKDLTEWQQSGDCQITLSDLKLQYSTFSRVYFGPNLRSSGAYMSQLNPYDRSKGPEQTFKINFEDKASYDLLKPLDRLYVSTNDVTWTGDTNWAADLISFTLPVDESFMVFKAMGNGNMYSAQTYLLSGVFRSLRADKWLPEDSCATFMMIDSIEKIPIGLVKLWKEGYFSTRASKDNFEYIMGNITFVFKGFVPRTQKLKADPAISANRALVASMHRRQARHEERNPIEE